jgi:hypothetical protein
MAAENEQRLVLNNCTWKDVIAKNILNIQVIIRSLKNHYIAQDFVINALAQASSLSEKNILFHSAIECHILNPAFTYSITLLRNNDESWQYMMALIQKDARQQLINELQQIEPDNFTKQMDVLKEAIAMRIFKEHRNGFFAGGWGRTAIVQEIEKMIEGCENKIRESRKAMLAL